MYVAAAPGTCDGHGLFPVEIAAAADRCSVCFRGSWDNSSQGDIWCTCCDTVPRLLQIPLQSQARVLGERGQRQWEHVFDRRETSLVFRHACSPEVSYKPSQGQHLQLASTAVTTSQDSSLEKRNPPFIGNHISCSSPHNSYQKIAQGHVEAFFSFAA